MESSTTSRESSDLVGLNVGGILYKTSRTTLLHNPLSFFSRMLEGHIPSAKDENSNFIIDRDGQVFRHVLNFMRCGKMVLPDDFKEYSLLECEADFFSLDKLQNALKALKAVKAVKAVKEAKSLQIVSMVFNDGEMPSDGKRFRTTRKILLREDDSLFAKMLHGEVAVSKDAQGNLVISRDGSRFPLIHSYLKKGAMFTDLDAPTLESLSKEASYFSLEVLQHQLESIKALNQNIADYEKYSVRYPFLSLHVYCWSDGPCVVYADKPGGGNHNPWDVGDICEEHVRICGGVIAGVLDEQKLKPRLQVDKVVDLIRNKTTEDMVDFTVQRHNISKNCTKVVLHEFDETNPGSHEFEF